MKPKNYLAWAIPFVCLGACDTDSGANSSPVGVPTDSNGAPIDSSTAPNGTSSGVGPNVNGMPTSTTGAPLPTGPDGMPLPPGTGPTPTGTDPGPDATGPVTEPTNTGPAVDPPAPLDCTAVNPGRAPLRRLTRFEYNKTVAILLTDDTDPANALPPEVASEEDFYGNDADHQGVSRFLIEQYETVAGDIAARATATPEQLAALAPCAADVTAETEAACARSFVESFVPLAYRRPLEAAEVDELVTLQETLRANGTFEESLVSTMQAVLQSPDFLYRIEWGVPDPANPELMRPSEHEMASRLSYLYWGSMPDPVLRDTIENSDELLSDAGVLAQATRLLDHDNSRPVIRYFFDHYLPLNTLTDLARDEDLFPSFSSTIGSLMREETHRFLEHTIFESPEGTWPQALTAPYTFVNETLANFYGIPNVTGDDFQQVDVDPAQRLGLLTQAGLMAGTTITNNTNPVRRGNFILKTLLCVHIPLPTDPAVTEFVKPPEPDGATTGRMRYEAHRELGGVCISCHAQIDPAGFALENFDAVGLWRDQENGLTIDASGDLPAVPGPFTTPFELIQKLAVSERTQACFADNWMTFASGRQIEAADECSQQTVAEAFAASGYNIRELLLTLTQTDAFLYLSPQEAQ
jgi:hypothetical protein